MLFSTYTMLAGKWGVVVAAIFGWCCWSIPAIFRAAANPRLTAAARKQIIVLVLICLVPFLAFVAFTAIKPG
jgi:hypothetical protein